MNDTDYMNYALTLAARGRHSTRPNPMVGAVIVREGRIVGEGWHEKAGGPHAEVVAVHHAGERTHGATLYVTLEPCSHVGKTPPCAELIIRSGVSRVVCAMQDPFSRVNGEGIKQLRQAGIQVDVGIGMESAHKLNRGYLQVIQKDRPFISGKWAMTLDGKTATAGGESRWITSVESRWDAHRLRAAADAVSVGIGTVLADDPQLTVRYGDVSHQPSAVIWDTHARIPLASQLLTKRPTSTIVLVGEQCDLSAVEQIRATGATVILLPQSSSGRLDTTYALRALARQCAIQELFVEGGADLLGELLEQNCLDEITTYIAPKALGGEHAKGATGGKGVAHLAQARRYQVTDMARCGADIRITYARIEEKIACSQD